uniref:Uncharacterized protein n=1 Tax=Oryza punctata TaxID=4537 RepID=A0A0E0LB99_ORYPU
MVSIDTSPPIPHHHPRSPLSQCCVAVHGHWASSLPHLPTTVASPSSRRSLDFSVAARINSMQVYKHKCTDTCLSILRYQIYWSPLLRIPAQLPATVSPCLRATSSTPPVPPSTAAASAPWLGAALVQLGHLRYPLPSATSLPPEPSSPCCEQGFVTMFFLFVHGCKLSDQLCSEFSDVMQLLEASTPLNKAVASAQENY